jgi:hypothetical protein
MLQAKIRLEYPDQATAVAVARAVAPDNAAAPSGLTVTTRQTGNTVATDICLEGKFATFVATIDDLLEAATTAEKTLDIVKPKQSTTNPSSSPRHSQRAFVESNQPPVGKQWVK